MQEMEEKMETKGAGTGSSQQNRTPLRYKNRFTTKRIALMAMFMALSFAVSFLEFPIFPSASFLRLDFGNVFILLISFLLGPTEGVLVCLGKELFRALVSDSGGIGEIANVVVTSSYILLPSLVYRYHKGLKAVIPCLIGACFIGTLTALIINRFVTFPMYFGTEALVMYRAAFWFLAAFNLIKTVSVGILTVLLYKRLSNFLKKLKI